MVKQKNKRLLARLGSLIGVLLLMCCMILPASAADTGSSSSDEAISVIPFDRILLRSTGSSSVVSLPWAGSHFFGDSDISDSGIWVEGGFDYEMRGVSVSNGNYSILMDPEWDASNFRMVLECDRFYYNPTGGNGGFSVNLTNQATADFSISFRVNVLELSGDSYVPKYYNLSASSSGSSVSLTQLIHGAIDDHADVAGYDWYYITDLSVVISSVSADCNFGFTSGTRTSFNSAFTHWVNQFEIKTIVFEPASSSDVSFSWLIDSVSQFLTIEFWPDFSISVLLEIVFVIGLVLWFLRISI